MSPNDSRNLDEQGNHFSYALKKAASYISSDSVAYTTIESEEIKKRRPAPLKHDTEEYFIWVDQFVADNPEVEGIIFRRMLAESKFIPFINLLLSHHARMDDYAKETLDAAAQYDDTKILKYQPEPEAEQ